MTLHHDDELARRHWEQASLVVRHAYGLPIGPGQPLAQHDPRAQAMRTQHAQGEDDRARENFVVIQVEVDSLDWLQIGEAGQLRALMSRDQHWQPKPLAP